MGRPAAARATFIMIAREGWPGAQEEEEEGGGVYSYSADTIEGPRAPAQDWPEPPTQSPVKYPRVNSQSSE